MILIVAFGGISGHQKKFVNYTRTVWHVGIL